MEDEYQNEEYNEEYNEDYHADYNDYDYQNEVEKDDYVEESETEVVTQYGVWKKLPSKPYKWENKSWAELTGFQRAMIRSREFDDAHGWGGRWIWIPTPVAQPVAPPVAPVAPPVAPVQKTVFSYKAMLQKNEKPDAA